MTEPDTTPAFTPQTPRVLRVNLPRQLVRSLLVAIDAWRTTHGRPLGFSGVLTGDYARLYLDTQGQPIPPELIGIVMRHIRHHRGTVAVAGRWMLNLEVAPVLDERGLWKETA